MILMVTADDYSYTKPLKGKGQIFEVTEPVPKAVIKVIQDHIKAQK